MADRALIAGEVLFSEGEEGGEMYVIREGGIQVTKQIGGESQVVAELKPGDFVGEMAILNQEPRSATCTAAEPTIVMVYDSSTFEQLIATRSAVALRIIQMLARRLKETTDQNIELLDTVEKLTGAAFES